MIIVVFILLLAIFFIFILIVISIIFFVKRKKKLGFIFISLALSIPMILYILYIGIEESTKPHILYESDIYSALKKEQIKLKNNFTIIDSKGQSDLYYYRTEFSLKLSDEDYKNLQKKTDTLKYIINANKNELIYDTINIRLTKDKVLHFYRSQHDFNN